MNPASISGRNKPDSGVGILRSLPVLLIITLLQALGVFFIVLAPGLALYLSRYLLIVLVAVLLIRFTPSSAPFWARILFLFVAGELVLNYGFSNFSIGAGSAKATVPELILLLSLSWITFRSWTVFWVVPIPAMLILLYALPSLAIHLPIGIMTHGIAAARDALPLVDSMFFFAGVACVGLADGREEWRAWRHRFLWIILIASLLYLPWYPLRETLLAYSPRVTGFQQTVPLLGYYATGNVIAMAGLLATILLPWQLSLSGAKKPNRILLFAALIVFAAGLVLTQSRTSYLLVFLVTVILVYNRHGQALRRIILALAVLIACLALADLSGISLKGRVGEIGLRVVASQLESVTGEGGLESARGGVHQRREWIDHSLRLWRADYSTRLVGIGFGQPLTNFHVGGSEGQSVIVREPHNSYISVLTRTGVFGGGPWFAFHFLLMSKLWKQNRHHRRKGDSQEADYWLWLFLFFLSMLVSALVQPVFESPHFAVPYFFFAGLSLAEIARNKAEWVAIARIQKRPGSLGRNSWKGKDNLEA